MESDWDRRHPSSPWRPAFVRAVQQLCGDPDEALPTWLELGATLGLLQTIQAGGLFPPTGDDTRLSLEELDASAIWPRNHPSFDARFDDGPPPGLKLMGEYVDSGFGELFENLDAAADHFGVRPRPSPLRTISKQKPGGSYEHRLIQHIRRSLVNDAVRLPERQVLPRPVDHAVDLSRCAHARRPGHRIQTLTLDFKDAFMSIRLDERECPYNCTSVDAGVTRTRPPMRTGEPTAGTVIVIASARVRRQAQPLVYSRAASIASCTAQALVSASPEVQGALQLYVDDPILVVSGSQDNVRETFDLVLIWWLLLGIPLAWKNGPVTAEPHPSVWIGVEFRLRGTAAVMTLPHEWAQDLICAAQPFAAGTGHVSVREAQTLVGRAGRVAHIVPDARPLASALYSALHESIRHPRDAPPGRCAARRFQVGARWSTALLADEADKPFVLERVIDVSRLEVPV